MERKKIEEDRQQTLDTIEKDIATALQSAGNALMELSKDKSSMKQVEGHATQFLKLLSHIESELNKQINYLTQVSTGHPHEGSSYASQKGYELARFRLDCMRYHISELDNLKNSRAGRIATASALAPPPQPPMQPDILQQQQQQQQNQMMQQAQTPPSQQAPQHNFIPQQMAMNQNPAMLNPNQGMVAQSPIGGMQIPSGPMSAGQMVQGQINPGQISGPGHMAGGAMGQGPVGQAPMGQQQMFQQQQMQQQQVPPQYMSPHHSMGHHNMMNQ